MTVNLKVITGAVLLAVLVGGGLYLKALRSDLARLEASAEAARREADGLARELLAHRRALAQREAERRALAAETETLKKELETVYAEDAEARDWADADCPGGVLECLRR